MTDLADVTTPVGLSGKVVIVTGGTSGIGLACVERLLAAGCKVSVAGRDEVKWTEHTLARHERARFISADITEEAAVERLVDKSIEVFGRLDAAINCAGTMPAGSPIHELSAEEWDKRCALNLRGMFFCLKYQIKAMREQGGSIVLISSTGADRAIAQGAEYSAAKAGVVRLARSAALENAANNIRINTVMPGAVMTPMLRRAWGENSAQRVSGAIPMRRVGRPAEIAGAAVWLVSDDASYVTGTEMVVDGGLLLT